jgi:hypothetical protein
MARQAERLARKENRSMSELMREAFRRYQQPVTDADMLNYVRMIAPANPALTAIRQEAKAKGTDKLTMRQIDREIKAARSEPTKKTTSRTSK